MKQFWHSWGRWLALLAACTGIFAAAFGLYHLPVAAALYPSALCGLLMLCVGGYDVWKRRQKLRMLHALAASSSPSKAVRRSGRSSGNAARAWSMRSFCRRFQTS